MLLHLWANRGSWLPNALPNQEEGEPDRISKGEADVFESFLTFCEASRAERPRKFIRKQALLGASRDSHGT